MSFYATDPQTGISIGPISDASLPAFQAEGVWTITSSPSSGGATINPLLPQAQQDFQNHLALGNLNNNTTNSEATMLGAQGQYLTGLSGEFEKYRGPDDWAQYANLMRGQTNSNLPAFINALEGISPLNAAYLDPSQLSPQNFSKDTAGVVGDGSANSVDTSHPPSGNQVTAPPAPASGQPAQQPAAATNSGQGWTSSMNADGTVHVTFAGGATNDIAPTDPAFKTYAPPSATATGSPAPAANPNASQMSGTSPDLANSGGSTSDGQGGNSKIDWKNERESAGIRADDSTPAIDAQFKSGDPVGSSSNPGDFSTLGQSANDPKNNPNANDPDNNHGDVVHAASGTMHVVHRPTTIHVGEHGRPELVVVHPLDNPGVPISAATAHAANALDASLHVQARPATGPIPIWARRMGPGHMASGGSTVYGGSLYGDDQTTITPSHQSFGSDTGFVSDTGQIKTAQGSLVPINEATPYIQPYQVRSSAYRQLTPLELQLYNSNLAAMGEDPQTYWARYQQSLPWMQQAPTTGRFVQTQAA